jgi:hypothetical protein
MFASSNVKWPLFSWNDKNLMKNDHENTEVYDPCVQTICPKQWELQATLMPQVSLLIVE